jgi:endonuclease-3
MMRIKMMIHERAIKTYEILDASSPAQITFLTQTDPFRLLISVILSAQTTDRQVNEVATVLFDRYPTVRDLAEADAETVKEIIKSTGYFNAKTKHILGTAQAISKDFGGEVPLEMDKLLTLPGVGRKTANVIIGQIGNQSAIIVDTHFKRVVQRLGLTVSSDPDRIEQEVAVLLPPAHHYRYSMVVNLHGRQICHAKKPQCGKCNLAPYCKSYPIQ